VVEFRHPECSVSVVTGTLRQSLRQLPLLISGAAGLVLGDLVAGQGHTLGAGTLAVTCAAGALLLWLGTASRRLGLLLLALAVANVRADHLYRPRFHRDHIANARAHMPLRIQGTLIADPESGIERTRLVLAAERIDSGEGWQPAEGEVLVTVSQLERRWTAGDRLAAQLTLRRPRNLGNPGEFDYEAYLARRGIYVTAFAPDDAAFYYLGHAGNGIAGWFGRWRRGVGALFQRTLPETEAEVLGALIVGTETTLPRKLRLAFSRAGVSHVLSISGLHVALVAGAAYALFRWLLARSRRLLLTINVPKLATALSVIPVLLYAGIAGSNVATIRSVIMILVFVAAILAGRQRHLVVSLAVAAIVILLWSPGAALDISFQLSFTAVLGLVWGMERFWPWWRRWEERRLVRLRGWHVRLWRPLAVYGMVSLTALTATVPLVALHFNQISVVAPLANALVVPLLGSAAVALGLIAALAYLISEPLAQCCVFIAGPFVKAGVWLVQGLSALPYASVRVVTPDAVELVLLYTALLALVRLSGRTRTAVLVLAALLALGDGIWWYADRFHCAALRITFLSVGQGDSAVVEFPGGEVMVIDAGGLRGESFDTGERVIAPVLWSRKIARVEYLVLSHPERDHYGGFAFLAANFSPREFWSNGAQAYTDQFARLQHVVHENGIKEVALHRGERRQIGDVHVAVESPPQQKGGFSANDQSLVLSLDFGGRRVLFPGDIETRSEENLVAAAAGSLTSAVLKVPHHGSNNSSSPRFLDAVSPQYAVVSAGFGNRFHFPHAAVLRRYAARGCRLARTDLDGAVHVRVSPTGEIAMQPERKPAAGAARSH
jgi:competence protein ComEC